ncbi:MAG: stage V sporulation protein AC [Clostridia bacterium]
MTNNEYSKMVEDYTKNSPIWTDCLKAFLVGGFICTIGEVFRHIYLSIGLSKTQAGTSVSITLAFIAAALTAMGVFEKIAKFAGAGTLVPITGFSNSVVSPAMEYKTEGLVTGTGAKMFIVAGPVIVYGTVASIIAGLIYYFFLR